MVTKSESMETIKSHTNGFVEKSGWKIQKGQNVKCNNKAHDENRTRHYRHQNLAIDVVRRMPKTQNLKS